MGENNKKKKYQSVAVAQVKDGKVIARYNSCTEAAIALGSNSKATIGNIAACANKKRKTALGYQWLKLTKVTITAK